MIKSTEEKRLRNKMGKIEHDEHQDHNKEVNDQKNSDKAKKALLSVDRSAYVSDFDRLHKELELSGDLNQSNASKLPLTSFRKNEGPIEPSSPSMKMETEGHNKMKKDPSDNNWQKEPLAKTSWDIPHVILYYSKPVYNIMNRMVLVEEKCLNELVPIQLRTLISQGS